MKFYEIHIDCDKEMRTIKTESYAHAQKLMRELRRDKIPFEMFRWTGVRVESVR